MAQRHRDAVLIQDGASNPLAIVNALQRAMRAVSDEGKDSRKDAACRMMTHQLAYLLDVHDSVCATLTYEVYSELLAECEAASAAPEGAA